jgi:hypothetical protein
MQNVLDLNEYGVAQMQNAEMESTKGGLWPLAVGAFILAVLNTDWDKAADDFNKGYKDAADADAAK